MRFREGVEDHNVLWPLPHQHEEAHQALVDVAKWLGFRDDRKETLSPGSGESAIDKYQWACGSRPDEIIAAIKARAAGVRSVKLPKARPISDA